MTTKKSLILRRSSTLFLRAAIYALGAAVLALCIFALPSMWNEAEGYRIGYAINGVVIVMWLTAIFFFIALFQGLRLLSYIDKNKAFSQLSVIALKRITYCAVAISFLYATTLPFFYTWAQYEDAPGLIVIGMIMVLAPLVVGVFSAVLQQLLTSAIKMKSENDLTV